MFQKIVKTEFPVIKNIAVGIPFGKGYYKPTPKFFRVLGDFILFLGTISAIIGASYQMPIWTVLSAVFAASGKYVTNCTSYLDEVRTEPEIKELKAK